MEKDEFTAASIARLIPSRGIEDDNIMEVAREESVQAKASEFAKKRRLQALKELKKKELQALHQEEAINNHNIDFEKRKIAAKKAIEAEKNIEMIEDAEFEARYSGQSVPAILQKRDVKTAKGAQLLALQGTTRREVQKLLNSLNINTNIQLSKNDTHNLVATLLTCSETQLVALQKNKKIPVAVQILIKRLLDDAKVGATDTVERLWDRVFGKAPDTPQAATTGTDTSIPSVIPNVPVSREALLLIKDTVIG